MYRARTHASADRPPTSSWERVGLRTPAEDPRSASCPVFSGEAREGISREPGPARQPLSACPAATPRPALTCSPSSCGRPRRGLAPGSRSTARSAGAAPSSSHSPPPAPPRSSSPAEHMPPPPPPAAAGHTGTPLESPAQTAIPEARPPAWAPEVQEQPAPPDSRSPRPQTGGGALGAGPRLEGRGRGGPQPNGGGIWCGGQGSGRGGAMEGRNQTSL